MFKNEFDNLSPETQQKVIKKIGKIHRWIEHSGGWSEVTIMAHSFIVFKAFEDIGFDVILKPRTPEAIQIAEDGQQNIILTDK
jgi:hypothetical protein